MKSTLTFILSLFLFLVSIEINAQEILTNEISADSAINEILELYKNAHNKKDFNLFEKYAITQSEYDSVIYFLKQNKADCLKKEDEEYKVSLFYDLFSISSAVNVKMDSIGFYKTSDLSYCGVYMKKIDAKIYFKNKSVELPFSLILMRKMNNQFRLLQQIFNYTSLTNE